MVVKSIKPNYRAVLTVAIVGRCFVCWATWRLFRNRRATLQIGNGTGLPATFSGIQPDLNPSFSVIADPPRFAAPSGKAANNARSWNLMREGIGMWSMTLIS
jgi:hypothetical protein